MFFRREKPRVPSFEERIDGLRQQGYATAPEEGGAVRAMRNGCGAVVRSGEGGQPLVGKAGWMMGQEIGALTDLGYMKVWQTPAGRREPALAEQLKALHAFEEDLREGLGLISLYNEGLGTTNDLHLYDRVEGRDRERARRPWER